VYNRFISTLKGGGKMQQVNKSKGSSKASALVIQLQKNIKDILLDYCIRKIEYLQWVRRYFIPFEKQEKNIKEFDYDFYVEMGTELFNKVNQNRTIPKAFHNITKNINAPDLIKKSFQPGTPIYQAHMILESTGSIGELYKKIFPTGEEAIIGLDVREKNAYGLIRDYCLKLFGIYHALWYSCYNNSQKDIVKYFHEIVKNDFYETIILNKAFEYMGYQKRNLLVRQGKQKNASGRTTKREKLMHIVGEELEKTNFHYNDIVISSIKDKGREHLIDYGDETIIKYMRRAAKRYNKRLRRDKQR
jgi:hypothetical protein